MNNMVVSPHWESAVMSQTQDLDSLESTETILPSCVFNKLTKYLDYLESTETILPSCVFQQTEQRFRLSGKYRNYFALLCFQQTDHRLFYDHIQKGPPSYPFPYAMRGSVENFVVFSNFVAIFCIFKPLCPQWPASYNRGWFSDWLK